MNKSENPNLKHPNNFVKLTRRERNNEPGVYDIEPYSLCKLVDALSGGKILEHIDLAILFNHFGVGINLTLSKFAKYLLRKMDRNSKESVFGKIVLETLDDFRKYFKTSMTLMDKDFSADEVKRYLKEHFDFNGKEFSRKADSQYINN